MALTNAEAALAETVNALISASDAAALTSIDKALEAGALLVEAKSSASYGSWLPFLARAGVPERKAQRLMTLARSGLKSDTVSDLGGIKAALQWYALKRKAEAKLVTLKHKNWGALLPSPDEGASDTARDAFFARLDGSGLSRRTIDHDLSIMTEVFRFAHPRVFAEEQDQLLDDDGDEALAA